MAQSRAQLEAQLPPDFRSGFSWFIEGKLAHMTWPEDEEIDFLNDQGIKMLVNLTDEDTSYRPIAEFFDIKCAKYSIPDHHPLGVDRVKEIMDLIDTAEGAVGFHCTLESDALFTILACYLVAREGYSADNAIIETRRRKKGETRMQEEAVREYERFLREEAVAHDEDEY